MSRAIYQRITSGTAICAVLAAGLAVPLGAWAQQTGERGGMWSQLRLTERFLTRDTTSPDDLVDGTSNQAITSLAYSFTTETRTEKLTFDIGGNYRFIDGPATDGLEGEFTSPDLRLRYDQVAAGASFTVVASARQDDLADVSPLSVSNSAGEALPTDIADLQEGGTRTELGFNSRLTLRDDAPFGVELGFVVNDISYADLPAGSALRDGITARTDVTGRFDISPVLQTRLGVRYRYAKTDGAAQTDRYAITGSATLAQPNGAYTLSADHADGDGGAVSNLSVGRSFELPQTKTNLALGMTRAGEDTFFVTGAAGLEHDFGSDSPFGPLSLSADRSVSVTASSTAQVLTSLSLGGSYVISPVARLRLTAELGQAEEVATGDTVTLSEVALALNYDISRDWRAAADVRAKQRDPSDSTATESTTFGVSVTRNFAFRH